ncbi:MAG TPA: hypothetical protein VFS33_09530 [Gemmatimonadales bacterium]|nr:hypothetical protein [Gemmatimonadales bacterium]
MHLRHRSHSLDTPTLEFLQAALAHHRIVFLGDIHPIAEPKELVARLIAGQGGGATIDLLALEVGADQQETIDRYLASSPEDTTILMRQPRTLRAHWGASAEYLDIYRAAYRWNTEHADHPVHVLAADIRGWPVAPVTERMATGAFANRDLWMAAAFRKTLQEHPQWRALVFMGGYHGLKSGGGEVMVGRAHDRFDNWFAGYLVQAGLDVYTVLADARQANGHGATRVFDRLAEAHPKGNFVVALDQSTDVVAEPIYNVEEQGYHLEFWPSRFPIRQAADAMLVLNDTRPITILRGER